jgi:gamma-glutamylcyclotransferase (GGCT)/AIG2-like uncharacterized protein YtfP
MKYLSYFGYGSNLNPDIMKRRIGDWKSVRKAVLRDYRFVFMPRPGVVVPVIVPSNGDKVLGAVYEITEDQLLEIDKYERPYSTEMVEVETEDGKMEALAYVFNLENLLLRADEYVARWIEGLKRQNFSDEEIAEVKKMMNESVEEIMRMAEEEN